MSVRNYAERPAAGVSISSVDIRPATRFVGIMADGAEVAIAPSLSGDYPAWEKLRRVTTGHIAEAHLEIARQTFTTRGDGATAEAAYAALVAATAQRLTVKPSPQDMATVARWLDQALAVKKPSEGPMQHLYAEPNTPAEALRGHNMRPVAVIPSQAAA